MESKVRMPTTVRAWLPRMDCELTIEKAVGIP